MHDCRVATLTANGHRHIPDLGLAMSSIKLNPRGYGSDSHREVLIHIGRWGSPATSETCLSL